MASGKVLVEKKLTVETGAELTSSNDGKYIAINSGVNTRKLYLWKWQDDEPREIKTDLKGRGLEGISFSPDGKLLAGVQEFFGVYAWEIPSGRLVYEVKSPEKGLELSGKPIFTPNGKSLALILIDHGTSVGKVQLLDAATGKLQGTLPGTINRGTLAVSADSRYLAATVKARSPDLDLTSEKQ